MVTRTIGEHPRYKFTTDVQDAVRKALAQARPYTTHWVYYMSEDSRSQFASLRHFIMVCMEYRNMISN